MPKIKIFKLASIIVLSVFLCQSIAFSQSDLLSRDHLANHSRLRGDKITQMDYAYEAEFWREIRQVFRTMEGDGPDAAGDGIDVRGVSIPLSEIQLHISELRSLRDIEAPSDRLSAAYSLAERTLVRYTTAILDILHLTEEVFPELPKYGGKLGIRRSAQYMLDFFRRQDVVSVFTESPYMEEILGELREGFVDLLLEVPVHTQDSGDLEFNGQQLLFNLTMLIDAADSIYRTIHAWALPDQLQYLPESARFSDVKVIPTIQTKLKDKRLIMLAKGKRVPYPPLVVAQPQVPEDLSLYTIERMLNLFVYEVVKNAIDASSEGVPIDNIEVALMDSNVSIKVANQGSMLNSVTHYCPVNFLTKIAMT